MWWYWLVAIVLFFPFLKGSIWVWEKESNPADNKGEQVGILCIVALFAALWPVILFCLAAAGFFYLIRPIFFHNSSEDD